MDGTGRALNLKSEGSSLEGGGGAGLDLEPELRLNGLGIVGFNSVRFGSTGPCPPGPPKVVVEPVPLLKTLVSGDRKVDGDGALLLRASQELDPKKLKS